MKKSITKYIIILSLLVAGIFVMLGIIYLQSRSMTISIALTISASLLISILGFGIYLFRKLTLWQTKDVVCKSEQFYKSIIDMAPDGIITINDQGQVESFSNAAEKIFGYRAEEMIGKNVKCLMPDPVRAKHDYYLLRHRQTGESYFIGGGPREVLCQRCDGSTFPGGLTINEMTLENGQLRYIGIIRDITLRKQRDEAIYEIDKRFALIVNGIHDGIWDWDLTTGKIYFSPRWKNMLGYEEDQIEDNFLALQDLIHADDLGVALDAWLSCVDGHSNTFSVEYRLKNKQGEYRWILSRGLSQMNAQGNPVRMAGSHTDITQRKRDYNELREMTVELEAKAESLGRINAELDQFAYITSHDLKAPLRAIANLSQWIEEDLQQVMTDDTRNQMKLLRGRVDRMEGLINGILSYSRIGRVDMELETVDTGKLLQEILEGLAPPEDFRIDIPDNMPIIKTARVPLFQIFSNLLSNAIKYHHRADGHIEVSFSEFPEITGYEFCISDDGPGIAPEYHEKVFQIFQTLQARDTVESTGVGLTLVKKIIEQLGGKIKLESKEGEGARFIFSLPKSARIVDEDTQESRPNYDAKLKVS